MAKCDGVSAASLRVFKPFVDVAGCCGYYCSLGGGWTATLVVVFIECGRWSGRMRRRAASQNCWSLDEIYPQVGLISGSIQPITDDCSLLLAV